jgi:STE24 endopeptidase
MGRSEVETAQMKRCLARCFDAPSRSMKALLCLCFALQLMAGPVSTLAQTERDRLTSSAATAGQLDPAAATKAWLQSVPLDKRTRSDAYFEGGYWFILWNFLVGAGISIFLLASGLSARWRDFAERSRRFRFAQPAIYAVPYILAIFVLSLPLNIYQNYFREHFYGLATQTFAPWFTEQLIQLGIALIGSMIGLVVLYAVFRKAQRTWWLWGIAVGFAFLFIAMLIAPVLIAPLFNTYRPVADPAINQPILAMARANEIPVMQVFEVDESRQTNRISANVSGILGTARIALNDNLLKQCTLPEIRAVMAHEMGHYVLNHAFKLILYFTLLIAGAFAFSRLFFDLAVRRWGARWRVRGIADLAGFPLLTFLFSLYFFLVTPLSNTAVRVTEREADAFGINTSREADGFAKVTLKLAAYRKLDPAPLEEIIFYDHPSGRARIRMAMDWKAANLPAGDAGGRLAPSR